MVVCNVSKLELEFLSFIDFNHQISISLMNHQIFLFQFAIYLVELRLSADDHVLGVCLTGLGCVVAVYVVMVLPVMIPEKDKEAKFKPFGKGCFVQDVV